VKGRRVRLLTVVGIGVSADVVVAADVPVADLHPALVELMGSWQFARDDSRWELHTAAGTILRPTATLHDQGVQDGEVLRLRISQQPDNVPGAAP
jgi:WXG100 protein secretion system (Wss), protein YukD